MNAFLIFIWAVALVFAASVWVIAIQTKTSIWIVAPVLVAVAIVGGVIGFGKGFLFAFLRSLSP
jgi:hypothetical protein